MCVGATTRMAIMSVKKILAFKKRFNAFLESR